MSNIVDIGNLLNDDMYIDGLSTSNNNNIDTEFTSMSWSSLVDEECDTTNDKILTGSLTNLNIKLEKVDDIIKINFKDLSDIDLLEYELIVSNCLRNDIKIFCEKVLDQQNTSTEHIIEKLNWMLNVCQYFSKKLGLRIYIKSSNNINTINRSSYKFCNYNYECQFNYNVKKYEGCFAQHFVHNIVYGDIISLRDFILNFNNKINNTTANEIIKSINTINYVINHMYDELKSVHKHINNHIESIVPKKKSKRHKNKKSCSAIIKTL